MCIYCLREASSRGPWFDFYICWGGGSRFALLLWDVGSGKKFRCFLNLFTSLISRAAFRRFIIYPTALYSCFFFFALYNLSLCAYFRWLLSLAYFTSLFLVQHPTSQPREEPEVAPTPSGTRGGTPRGTRGGVLGVPSGFSARVDQPEPPPRVDQPEPHLGFSQRVVT